MFGSWNGSVQDDKSELESKALSVQDDGSASFMTTILQLRWKEASRLEGNVSGLGDPEDRLMVGSGLPGGTNGFNLVMVLLGVGVVDNKELGAQTRRALCIFALPLSINIENAETCGKAWGHFAVEKVAPFGFADSLLRLVNGPKPEVEPRIDPAFCGGGMRGIA